MQLQEHPLSSQPPKVPGTDTFRRINSPNCTQKLAMLHHRGTGLESEDPLGGDYLILNPHLHLTADLRARIRD